MHRTEPRCFFNGNRRCDAEEATVEAKANFEIHLASTGLVVAFYDPKKKTLISSGKYGDFWKVHRGRMPTLGEDVINKAQYVTVGSDLTTWILGHAAFQDKGDPLVLQVKQKEFV